MSARVLAVDGGATLTVQDDGRGFDPAAVPSGGHMGLHIMSERLERVARHAHGGERAGPRDDDPRGLAAACFGRAPSGENGSVTDTDDIRVLIVDDHQMVREGLKVLLSTFADIEVVGEAANGLEAVDQCRLVDPDVVLMDVQMPVMDGPEATAEIGLTCPDVRVIALTSFVDQDSVEKALDAGAISYLLKDARPEALTQAIRDAVDGRGTIDSSVTRALMDRRQDDGGRRPDTPRARGARAPRGWPQQQGDRRAAHAQRGHRPPARQQHPLQARRAQPHDRGRHRHEARPGLTHLSHLSGSR